jgi:hypothetical protein
VPVTRIGIITRGHRAVVIGGRGAAPRHAGFDQLRAPG